MRRTLRTTTAAALAAGGVLLALNTSVAADPTDPADFGEPTAEQIADSIHVWDPTGHVEPIESTETDGDETVLSLDSDILFAFGSSEMPPSAAAKIAELVADVPEGAAVSVTGHTDDIGTDADNLELSKDRAATVAAAVTAARSDLVLTVEGLGESDPVESNGKPEGREANRRVEIRYSG